MYSLNEKLLAETQMKLRGGKTLDANSLNELRNKFGDKVERDLKVLEARHVKKYLLQPSKREVWIVVGKTREYQVFPRLFCMCDDFYLNVVIRRTDPLCYHILAQMMAEATGRIDEIREEDGKFELLMHEWSSTAGERPT
jgi:predicted nucleic acid-binding Zn finger protein